jgi:hypothetical protein
MSFHRLTVPSYFGGLPGGYDYINNALVGTPAVADGQKSGGPNDGTYFIAFGEDVTEADANRPNLALAENCDFLDDVARRDLAVPVLKEVVLAGATQFVLPGEIFVAMPGTASSADVRNQLVVVYKNWSGTLLPADAFTAEFKAIPILVTGIENGSGASVIEDPPGAGGDSDGFFTDPTIKIDQSLTGTYYVLCYERSNAVNRSPGMISKLEQLNIPPATLHTAILNNAVCGPAGGLPNWKDGETNPAPVTVDNQIKKIITDLGVDVEGSDRINSQDYTSPNTILSLTDDVSIFYQLKQIVDFIDLMLDSRDNTWGGKQLLIPPAGVDALVVQPPNGTSGRGIYIDITGSSPALKIDATSTSKGIELQSIATGIDVTSTQNQAISAQGQDLGMFVFGTAGGGDNVWGIQSVAGGVGAGYFQIGVYGAALKASDDLSIGVMGAPYYVAPVGPFVGVFGTCDHTFTMPTVTGVGGLFWGKGASEAHVSESEGAGVVGIGGTHAGSDAGHGVIGIGADSDVAGNNGGLFYGGTRPGGGKGHDGVKIFGGDGVGTDEDGGRGLYVEGGSRTGAGQNGLAIWGHYKTGPGGSGWGMRGTGRYGGAGGLFDNNNAQNDRDAIFVNSGIRFYRGGSDDGSQYPSSSFGLKNVLKAIAIPKLWATVLCDGASSPSLQDGMNVANVTYDGTPKELGITIAEDMANSNYCVQATVYGNTPYFTTVNGQGTAGFDIAVFDSSGTQVDLASSNIEIHVAVFGRQPMDDYPNIS